MNEQNATSKPKEPISGQEEQQILLQIVETWRLNEFPEYRGFRCANCQQYKNEAWYHWVNTAHEAGQFRLPIHMCNDTCEPAFQNDTIQIDQAKRTQVDRESFGNNYNFSDSTKRKFRGIVASWPDYKKPELKAFTCDDCGNDLEIDKTDGARKGYHVWWKMDDGKTLTELHFHRDCGHKLGIFTKEELAQQNQQ